MSQTIKDRIIPLASLLAGVAVVYVIGAVRHSSQQAAEAVIQQRFDDLEPIEQERLLDRADGMNANLKTSPELYERLQHIHTALESDPKLSDKLKRLHEWWLTLDAENKNRLKPSGNRFAEDWAKRVEEVYFETRNKPGEFVIKLRSRFGFGASEEMFRTDEVAFNRFLAIVIPEETPKELAERLVGLSGSDQESERTLAKIIWLQKQLMGEFGRPAEPPDGNRLHTKIAAAATESLILSADQQRLADFKKKSVADAPPDRRADAEADWWPRNLTVNILRSGRDHYYSMFRAKHLGPQKEGLIEIFEGLDRNSQIDLMSRDAREAEKNLERRLIEINSAKSPAIAGIAEDLQEFRELSILRWGSRFGESRGRGGRGGRPPQRGEGPPEEARRDGGDPRDRERRGERGPDGGGRGPGGGRGGEPRPGEGPPPR